MGTSSADPCRWASYWHSYEFAGSHGQTGSRTKETWHAAGGDTTRTYTYPNQGGGAGSKPHTLTQVDTDRPGTSNDTVDTYQYDTTGNTTTRNIAGTAHILTWDNEGRLASTNKTGQTVSYLYDADGQRLIRRDPQGVGTTLYLPGGQEVNVAPGASTAKATRYYRHFDVQIAVRTAASGLTFVIGDHHETAEANIKASDLTVQRRRSLPYGDPRGTTPGVWAGDKGFVGGTNDPMGLTHLGARLYEQATGRFISVDPIIDVTDPQQMHGYAYSNNAPPTFTDPTGLFLSGLWNKTTSAISNTVDKVTNAVSDAATSVSDWADRNAEAINETLQFVAVAAVAVAAAVVLVGMCAVPPGAGCVIGAALAAGMIAGATDFTFDVIQGDKEPTLEGALSTINLHAAVGGATAGLGVGVSKAVTWGIGKVAGGRITAGLGDDAANTGFKSVDDKIAEHTQSAANRKLQAEANPAKVVIEGIQTAGKGTKTVAGTPVAPNPATNGVGPWAAQAGPEVGVMLIVVIARGVKWAVQQAKNKIAAQLRSRYGRFEE